MESWFTTEGSPAQQPVKIIFDLALIFDLHLCSSRPSNELKGRARLGGSPNPQNLTKVESKPETEYDKHRGTDLGTNR
jgi:hypothetical protein